MAADPQEGAAVPHEQLVFTGDEVLAFLNEVWPEAQRRWTIESLTPFSARVREQTSVADLRPGGTVSGPTLMKLADVAGYIMVLGRLGRAALAVTSSFQIDFLRRPTVGELIADVDLVKMGRSLAVMNVRLYSVEVGTQPNVAKPVATCSVTYSLSLV